MTFVTPTVANIMARAFAMARRRLELLILLGLLSGILSSIVYTPASKVLDALFTALEKAEQTGGTMTEAARILNEGASTLLMGQVMVTLVATFLLVPWARAAAPGGLVPNDGGLPAFLRRGVRSFLHMLAAHGMTVLIILFVMPLAAMIGSFLGPFGPFLIMIAVMAMIWITMALIGTANLAIAAEARDRRETLFSAWVRARLFIRPIVGSLSALFLLLMFADLLIEGLIVSILPAGIARTLSSAAGGALIYAISALHIAGIYVVPDFRDLRPDDLTSA
ncbi:hypothetical protein [Kordiimonas marina]|uniref:hypothetical protein n=1 Tax=Kordiimonas marina TaxID=2872312 RepID=UPI001FF40A95|nr:hypothetical protein [Kordiimonas marina]MCJ9427584.1 hypothetical protein [Kordiimonas marina]